MAKASNLAKKAMEQPYQCKFCSTKFHKESTLSTHMCVKKQRHIDINTSGSRFGFRAFQRFYDLTVKSKKPKTQQEFIDSPYYIDFVKFGNHIALLKPLHPEKFIDFVIMGGLKLKDWTKDYVYEFYIEDLLKKEPAIAATERSIAEIADWCDKNAVSFNDFFRKVSANEAAYMVKTGKVSPWVLYLCETGNDLVASFTEDHSKMIAGIIEPGFWMKKFRKSEEDVDYIRSVLEAAKL
jgi:hypothetical protein